MVRQAAATGEKTNTESEPKFFKVYPTLTNRWGLSRSTIYQLMLSGKLFSVKIGTSRRVPLSAVEEFERELMANGEI